MHLIFALIAASSMASATEPESVLAPRPPLDAPGGAHGKRSEQADEAQEPKEPKEPKVVHEPRPGVRFGPRIGGGGVLGGTVSWDLGTGTLIDLGLSMRPAVRDLEWSSNLMASAGVGWELWGHRAKQGLFTAAGSCIPGLPYYETYLAGGYHFRLTNSKGRFGWQLRLGGGVMPYGELNSQPQGIRPMVYLSSDLLWLVKEAT
mgnify:CR=1 FL=1